MRGTEIALAVGAGGLWIAGYLCVKALSPNRSVEWCSRVVAGAHAVIVTGLAANAVRLGPHPLLEAGADNEYAQDVTVAVSLGYFVYDLAWVIYYTPEERVMLAHHSISVLAFTAVLLSGRSGIETCAALVAMELTNPLLQTRWFIRDAGYKNTTVFKIVDLSFVTLFFVCRIGVGTYFTLRICQHPRPSAIIKGSAIAFYGVSWVFLVAMMRYVYRKYISSAPPPDPSA